MTQYIEKLETLTTLSILHKFQPFARTIAIVMACHISRSKSSILAKSKLNQQVCA